MLPAPRPTEPPEGGWKPPINIASGIVSFLRKRLPLVQAARLGWSLLPEDTKAEAQDIFSSMNQPDPFGLELGLPEEEIAAKIDELGEGAWNWIERQFGGGEQEPTGIATLPMDEESRRARSEQQEFGSEVYYHGTGADISEFDLDHPDRKDQGWLGTGVYMTNSPSLGSVYSNMKGYKRGANVIPLRIRLNNPYYATPEEKQRMRFQMNDVSTEEAREIADAWTADLQERGYDGVILQYDPKEAKVFGDENLYAIREVVVFDPRNIRSIFAEFDPAQSESPALSKAHGGFVVKPLYEDARMIG